MVEMLLWDRFISDDVTVSLSSPPLEKQPAVGFLSPRGGGGGGGGGFYCGSGGCACLQICTRLIGYSLHIIRNFIGGK